MLYYFTFSCCLLYLFTNIQINFALASENASSSSESKSKSNGIEEDPAKLTLAKYVVSLRRKKKLNSRYNNHFGSTHFCGGAILSPKLILTTAHCLINRNGSRIRPSALEVVTSTPIRLVRTMHTQIIEVSNVEVHSRFGRRNGIFDIGLLQLKSKIDLDGAYAQEIPLPRVPPVVGIACTTLGWGKLYWEGPFANEILYGNVTVMNSSYCRRKFPFFAYRQICAFNPYGIEKSVCTGDSGGPLICDGSVTGLVSYGYLCAGGSPSVYTDVYEYLDWISRSKSEKLGAFLWKLWFLSVFWTTICS